MKALLLVLVLLFGGVFYLKKRQDAAREDARNNQVALVSPTPAEAPKAEYQLCSQHKWCSVIRDHEQKCRVTRNARDCKIFVKYFTRLSGNAGCKRRNGKEVVSLWLCDDDPEENAYPKISERAVQTLSEIKEAPYAAKLYYSENFRNTLYTYLKEKHFEKSLAGPQPQKKK